MNPLSARVSRRRRQVAAGVGVVVGGYLVLVLIALLGGPRIGAPFLPLPGGGPEPASPIAAPQPGQPGENIAIPHSSTSATPSFAATTPLPTATTPDEPGVPAGSTATPYPARTDGTPTPQIVETTVPTLAPATRRPPTAVPPTAPPATDGPTLNPTVPPTATPTAPSPSPTASPTTPTDPGTGGGLGATLGRLLHKLGL
ncbi:MAG TPA: hypothetical protein VG497_09290 [Kribbella sp.]|nr:hypothetical protein [Kribbella sp.]